MRVSRSQKTPRPKSAEESPLAGHHWCLRQRLSGPGPSCPGSPPPPAGPPPPGGPPLGHAFPARRRWGGSDYGGEGRGSARLSGRAARREMGGEREAAGSKSKGPATRHRTGLGAVPCAFRSSEEAAALFCFAKLQNLGNPRQASRSPLSSRPPPPSFFLLFSLFPFSLLLSHSPRRTFLRTGGWLFPPPRVWGSGWRRVPRAGLGTITAQGSFLGGDGGGSGGGCGRGSPAPASNRTGR